MKKTCYLVLVFMVFLATSVSADNSTCGNGIIEEPEECDDMNTYGLDGCGSNCEEESGWFCYNEPSYCTQTPFCGNGIIDEGEECDGSFSTHGSGNGQTTIVGDSVEFGTAADLLEVGEFIGDVKETLTETDLDALQGGSVSTDKGSTVYNQYIRFDDNEDIQSGRVLYEENEQGIANHYLKFNHGDVMFEYHLEFEDGLESDIDDDLFLEDLLDENMLIFGSDYAIVGAEVEDNSIKLNFILGMSIDTIEEGETKIYYVEENLYDVTFLYKNETNGSYYITFEVNGEIIEPLLVGESYELSDGIDIGVREFLVNDRHSIVEFYLGAIAVEFYDDDFTDDEYYEAGLTVQEEVVDESIISIKAQFTGGDGDGVADPNDVLAITSIKHRLRADALNGDTIYIPIGQGLKEHIDQPNGMLNLNWNIRYEGLMDTGTTDMFFYGNNSSYNLSFVNRNGLIYDIPFMSNQNEFKFGNENDLFFTENCSLNETNETDCYFIGINDYFVLTDDNDETGMTNVFQFISADENSINLLDLANGPQSASYSGNASIMDDATGTIKASGKDFIFYVYNDTNETKLCFDLDNSGSCKDGGYIYIVDRGGGILDLGDNNFPETEAEIRLITLESEFDENGRNNSGENETITFTIESRPENTIGLDIQNQDHLLLYGNNSTNNYTGLSYYGVYFEFIDENPEILLIEYPLSQRGVQVFATAGTVSTIRGRDGDGGSLPHNNGGCDTDCTVNPKWVCSGEPSVCNFTGYCGSGHSCECGDLVIDSVVLENDLIDCSSIGLRVYNDSLKLDCNGHKITGSGGGFGVMILENMDVSVTGCAVENFNYGVGVTDAENNTLWNNSFNSALEEYNVQSTFWDFNGLGNYWFDFQSNPGYPDNYVIPGGQGGVDNYPMYCGDENIQFHEECDDGNSDNSDSCLNTCVAAFCGDNVVQTGVEECDDGANGIDTDSCYDDCTLTFCGDAICGDEEFCNTCSQDCGACPVSGGGGGGGGGYVLTCEADWDCEEWSECNEGIQTRVCEKTNFCPNIDNKPEEERSCGTDEENFEEEAVEETDELNELSEATGETSVENNIGDNTDEELASEDNLITGAVVADTPLYTSPWVLYVVIFISVVIITLLIVRKLRA